MGWVAPPVGTLLRIVDEERQGVNGVGRCAAAAAAERDRDRGGVAVDGDLLTS